MLHNQQKSPNQISCQRCHYVPKEFVLLKCNHLLCLECCVLLESDRNDTSIITCICGIKTMLRDQNNSQIPLQTSPKSLPQEYEHTLATQPLPSSAKQLDSSHHHPSHNNNNYNQYANVRAGSIKKQKFISSFELYNSHIQGSSSNLPQPNQPSKQQLSKNLSSCTQKIKTEISEADDQQTAIHSSGSPVPVSKQSQQVGRLRRQNTQPAESNQQIPSPTPQSSISVSLQKELDYAQVQFNKAIDQIKDAFSKQLEKFRKTFDEYRQNLRVWYVELSAAETEYIINIPRFLREKYTKLNNYLESFLNKIFDFSNDYRDPPCPAVPSLNEHRSNSSFGCSHSRKYGLIPSYLSPKPSSYLKHTSQFSLLSPPPVEMQSALGICPNSPSSTMLRKRRITAEHNFVEQLINQKRNYRKKSGLLAQFK